MTSPCKTISNTRFCFGNDPSLDWAAASGPAFVLKSIVIMRTSMQRVGVDL